MHNIISSSLHVARHSGLYYTNVACISAEAGMIDNIQYAYLLNRQFDQIPQQMAANCTLLPWLQFFSAFSILVAQFLLSQTCLIYFLFNKCIFH